MATGIKVHGLGKLMAKIEKIPGEVQEEMLTVMTESAKQIQNGAKSRVRVKTGALKRSIRVQMAEDELAMVIGPMGKDAWRAHFEEFGTRHSSANPFMTPAYEETKPHYISGISRAIRKVITK